MPSGLARLAWDMLPGKRIPKLTGILPANISLTSHLPNYVRSITTITGHSASTRPRLPPQHSPARMGLCGVAPWLREQGTLRETGFSRPDCHVCINFVPLAYPEHLYTGLYLPTTLPLIQRRFAPRNTMNRWTHLKRKRRHGFLARLRSTGGRAILSRRRRKRRRYLSH